MAVRETPDEFLRVLCVEDSQDDVELLRWMLADQGFRPVTHRVDQEPDFLAALEEPWDLVISDHSMPVFSSMRALSVLRERGFDYPFIVVSGMISEEAAVDAMRAGAQDYVLKGDLRRLIPAIRRELAEAENRRLKRHAEAALAASEHQLRQAQKMEAVGQLAAGVAHDFNNVLTVILGFSQFVLEELDSETQPWKDVEQIALAAQRASQMTRQLLSFSRQQILTPEEVRLDHLLTTLVPMLQRLIGEDITVDVGVLTPIPVVRLDPSQFEQAIVNLAVNARDAMPMGGCLTCRLSQVDLPAASAAALAVAAGPYVLCEVTDTGHGMDEATMARIFEPFFTTKEPGRGTGLGLSSVFGGIRQYGGGISVSSTPAVGTTFRLYFPVSAVEELPAPAPPRRVRRQVGDEAILLVEDEIHLRDLVSKMLTHAGYQVTAARSCEHALQIGRDPTLRFDLVISDVVMPQMLGPVLAAQLQAARGDLPVLFMSGYAEHVAISAGLDLPRTALLKKPFSRSELLAAVRQAIESGDEG